MDVPGFWARDWEGCLGWMGVPRLVDSGGKRAWWNWIWELWGTGLFWQGLGVPFKGFDGKVFMSYIR
jgi:hypothetical protein